MHHANQYQALKEQQQQEVNAFPFFFAFSEEQFSRGMRSFGLLPDELDKIYKLGSTGGFFRRTDADRLHEMLDRHEVEMQAAVDGDASGDGFIYEMFLYELANHEYTYTNDLTDTLYALDLTAEEINADKRLQHGLRKAVAELREMEEE